MEYDNDAKIEPENNFPDDGGSMYLRSVGLLLQDYTALYPYSPPSEPEMSQPRGRYEEVEPRTQHWMCLQGLR
jgi:hypothetical protein